MVKESFKTYSTDLKTYKVFNGMVFGVGGLKVYLVECATVCVKGAVILTKIFVANLNSKKTQ